MDDFFIFALLKFTQMKTTQLLFTFLLISFGTLAQKKDKIKGSRTVTIETKTVKPFNSFEVEDNIEVYLESGDKNEIKIEADDNLQEIIELDVHDNNLRIHTNKTASSHKKLAVHVVYTSYLKAVTAKNEAVIYAIKPLELDELSIITTDYAKLFLNVNAAQFNLKASDKTKAEINLKSGSGYFQLSNNANIKALVISNQFKCDMYQKTSAEIEGEALEAQYRLDNNASFIGNKLTVKKLQLDTENYATCMVFAEEKIVLAANDESEIHLFGNPKIEVAKFEKEAKLIKRIK